MNENTWPLVALCGGLLLFLLLVSVLMKNYSLNNIKNKTVGDGQHGTARWATPKEIQKTYRIVPYRPAVARGKEPADRTGNRPRKCRWRWKKNFGRTRQYPRARGQR
jgi:hypothetical protein